MVRLRGLSLLQLAFGRNVLTSLEANSGARPFSHLSHFCFLSTSLREMAQHDLNIVDKAIKSPPEQTKIPKINIFIAQDKSGYPCNTFLISLQKHIL